MPDSTSPFDDPFADLFGKLPDPRQRRGAGDDAAHGGDRSATPAPAQPAAAACRCPGVQAREAAARQAAPATRGGSATPAAAPAARAAARAAPPSRVAPESRPRRTCDAMPRPSSTVRRGCRRLALLGGIGATRRDRASGDRVDRAPAATATPRGPVHRRAHHRRASARCRRRRTSASAASAAGSRSASSCSSSAASQRAASGCGTPTRTRSAR